MRTPPPSFSTPPSGHPATSEAITALLPVGPGTDLAHLHRALISLREQTHPPETTLVIANGVSDHEFAALSHTLASGTARPDLRLRRLPRANLAAALNAGLRESHTRLVARMDADVVCFQELRATSFATWSNLASELGYPYAAISGNGPLSGSLYNGYFSRFPR